MNQRPLRYSAVLFVFLCLLVVGALGGYVAWTRGLPASPSETRGAMSSPALAIDAVQQRPHLLFRHTAMNGAYGRVALAPLDNLNASPAVTPLACDRVHFAGGRGVCLRAERSAVVTAYRAVVFDESFAPLHDIPLPGVPSRVRVAPDGRRAGITVFRSGDSYALAGGFSTRTIVIDTETGKVLGNLEEYAVTQNGRPFKAVDFNFWGVTFLDANRFYATLESGRRTYLIEGNVDAKQARTVYEGVECPSLSPDQTRVVFKKKVTSGIYLTWRVAVLDLATLRETLIADTRNVDDQSEWLDNDHVVYGRASETRASSTDLWVAPADGSGSPRVLIKDAWSPAFVPATSQNEELRTKN